MNNLHDTSMDRLLDLLAARATEGLSDAEAVELEQLLRQHPDVDQDQFDVAAAALAGAFVASEASLSLPASLRTKIERDFEASAPKQSTLQRPISDTPALQVSTEQSQTERAIAPIRIDSRRSVFGNLGWLAAAACLGLAIFAWLPKLRGPEKVDNKAVLRFAQAYPDSFTLSWADFNDLVTKEPPEVRDVKGQVVWSDTAQTGYMRFANLPKNNSAAESYQLWIIDAERGLSQRVSGAVFNVTESGETIVPIQPQLPISKASIFAITIERPGGVVVSDMSRRVSLAARP